MASRRFLFIVEKELDVKSLWAAVVCVLAVSSFGQGDFPPGKYAIYQLSNIESIESDEDGAWAVIPPLATLGIMKRLHLWGLATQDFSDTSAFALGGPWLWPSGDSLGRALRFRQAPGGSSLHLHYEVCDSVPRHTFSFTIYLPELGKTSLLHYSYHNTEGGTYESNEGTVLVTAEGQLVVDRNLWGTGHVLDTVKTHVLPAGVWIPMMIELGPENDGRYMSVFLGDSCVTKLRIGVQPSTSATTLTDITLLSHGVSFDGEVQCGDFAHFEHAGGAEVYTNQMNWTPVNEPGCRDTIVIPLVIHQIIYDPPGDGSVSTLVSGNTIATRQNFRNDYCWGGSVAAGIDIGVGVGIGIISFDVGGLQVEAKVTGDCRSTDYQSYVSTVTLNQELSSSVDDALASCIGPGGGDVIIYQGQTVERTLIRRPRAGIVTESNDSNYTYLISHRILAADDSRLRVARVSDLLESLEQDSAASAVLREEYAIDPATGRVRRDLIDNGRRLRKLDKEWNFAGNLPVTASETHGGSFESEGSFEWAIGGQMRVKYQKDFIFREVEGYFKYVRECGTVNSEDSMLTISYTLSDNESWDSYAVDVYYDSLHRVFVFDVDSGNSYASFPYEDRYAPRSVDLTLVGADTLRSGFTGDMLSYTATVRLESPSAVQGLPHSLTVQSEIINYPYTCAVQPREIDLTRNAQGTVVVQLSSPDSGTIGGTLRFSLMHPTDADEDAALDVPLWARFQKAQQGLYVECTGNPYVCTPAATVTHTFPVTLHNIGQTAITIETGISSVSQGVVHQMGAFANPVAAGDTRTISVALTGTGAHYPYTATFWATIQGDAASYKEIVLSIDTASAPVSVTEKPAVTYAPRHLEILPVRGGRLTAYVPGPDAARIRLFTMDGRCIFSAGNIVGQWQLPESVIRARNLPCVVELQRGKTRICRKALLMP